MFDSFLGQIQANEILSRTLKKGKISHAYLFQGPSGVGKKKAAYALARRLNCYDVRDDGRSCNKCASCKKMAAGVHPDFISILPDGTAIKIDQIRKLKKTLSYPPFESGYRLIFIPDIHLTLQRREVANSLLKTLEEPPPSTVFILTTDESSELLPTIVSRCQVVPFHHLSQIDIKKNLESQGIETTLAQKAAAASAGSLGVAEELCRNKHLELVEELIRNIASLKPTEPGVVEIIFRTAEKMVNLKDELGSLLDLLKLWYGDCLKAHTLSDASFFIWKDLQQNTATAKQRWNLSELSDKVALINQAQRQIKANCNKGFVCEILFWNLIQ